MRTALKVFYNCKNCPAYCCAYPRITVTDYDIERLAKHFGISKAKAKKRFTKKGEEPGERILRKKYDPYFESVCRFLDVETRQCTVYPARPRTCREYPGTARCGYYDFLMSERDRQKDSKMIATTDHRD
ncbi:MAG TPA: YkgJ family cysteine cluster protein [Fimbriimonadales bacterium]|nr:YkgJ family cysteine cluster protein [Fimbriimonadales bacterium]